MTWQDKIRYTLKPEIGEQRQTSNTTTHTNHFK